MISSLQKLNLMTPVHGVTLLSSRVRTQTGPWEGSVVPATHSALAGPFGAAAYKLRWSLWPLLWHHQAPFRSKVRNIFVAWANLARLLPEGPLAIATTQGVAAHLPTRTPAGGRSPRHYYY